MYHLFLIIFILTFVNKINAMDILHKNKIDNFAQNWNFISDQVMGGLSTGNFEIKNEFEEKFIRLSGIVSTKNNGGFIQIRSDFNFESKNFKGIRIKARGYPSEYYIHIRTNFLLMPWQYYSGGFEVSKDWKEVEILFKDFKKSNFYQPSKFGSSEITSIGFVAFGKNFEPKLDIIKAELF